jgi:hypothetical protein
MFGPPNFVTLSRTLWTASAAPKSPGLFNRLRGREGDQLSGKHRFDFTMEVPDEISIDDQACPPPPSFMESGSRGSVTWQLRVIVRRGKFGADSM